MAGGTIVDPHPAKRRHGRAGDLEAIARREGGGPVALLLERIGAAGLAGVKPRELAAATSLPAAEVEEHLRRETEAGNVVRVAGRAVATSKPLLISSLPVGMARS